MTEETINALCEKFHTTMENLIPVYSKYMITKDIISIVINLILLCICIIVFIYVWRGFKTKKFDEFDVLPWVGGVTTAIVGIVCIIIFFLTIYDRILWATNPGLRFLDTVLQIGG